MANEVAGLAPPAAPRVASFRPRVTPDCRVLVLGSMPGVASLKAQNYYAHPRNAFWPIMAMLTGLDAGAPIDQRIDRLNRAGIGLWDVLANCERRGSLDAAIDRSTEVPNAIPKLAGALPKLAVIALNGGLAQTAFRRHFGKDASLAARDIQQFALPSTSPAHASRRFAEKLAAWSVLQPWLRRPA